MKLLGNSFREKLYNHISDRIQLVLCDVGNYNDRYFLAKSSVVSEDVQLILADSDDYRICCILAYNLNISDRTRLVLTKNKCDDVRCALVHGCPDHYPQGTSYMSEEIQLILAKDRSYSVRVWLARSLNICEKVQLILAKDSYDCVRNDLRNNKNLCEEARELLELNI